MTDFIVTCFYFLVAAISLAFWFRHNPMRIFFVIEIMSWILWECGGKLETPEFIQRWFKVYIICGIIIGVLLSWIAKVPDLMKAPLRFAPVILLVFLAICINGVWLFVVGYATTLDASFPWSIIIALATHILGVAILAVVIEVMTNFTLILSELNLKRPLMFWFGLNLVLIILYLLQTSPSLTIVDHDVIFVGTVTSVMAGLTLMLAIQKIYSDRRDGKTTGVMDMLDEEPEEVNNGYDIISSTDESKGQ